MPEIERPDLSAMTTDELVAMMLGCSISPDPSDKQFAKFCRDEIAKRKPSSPDIGKPMTFDVAKEAQILAADIEERVFGRIGSFRFTDTEVGLLKALERSIRLSELTAVRSNLTRCRQEQSNDLCCNNCNCQGMRRSLEAIDARIDATKQPLKRNGGDREPTSTKGEIA